jgi:PKD domain
MTSAVADDGPTRGTSVERTSNGLLFRGMTTYVQHDVTEWSRNTDFERASDGYRRATRVVVQRPLTVHERAVIQAQRRAECLATFREVSRIFRTTGRGVPLSADGCHILADPTDPTQPAVVVITDEIVLTEVKSVGFASSVVHVQPKGNTLVNLDTNFYADRKMFDRAIPIQGQLIPVRATPKYTWHFGDGTTMQTTGPGAPYPDGDVTHKYLNRGKVVVSVTLNYDTWYRLPGQDWRQAGIVDIPGPGTAVQVCEARPVLTDPDNPNQYTPPADPSNPCTT